MAVNKRLKLLFSARGKYTKEIWRGCLFGEGTNNWALIAIKYVLV